MDNFLKGSLSASRGENSGRQLSHVAVVFEMAKVGKLEKWKSLTRDFQVKLKVPRADPANIRIVAFAQESGPERARWGVAK